MDNPNPKIFSPSSRTSIRLDCFDDDKADEVDSLEIFDLIKTINDPEHPVTLEQLNVVRPEHIYIRRSKSVGVSESTIVSCGSTSDRMNTSDTKSPRTHDSVSPTTVLVHFTPTIPHCSMATLIGLSIQLKLIRSLPASQYRILVQIRPGTHNSEIAINRQLGDKERVGAAGENSNLKRVVAACLMGPPRSGIAL